LSKTSSRDIKKRLFEFARNEFETKQPEYVEVRKAKGTKTFYRGPVPQLILTRYKAIAYTVFADYGTICRLYYFNRDGYCINDSSYSDNQLDKIKTHLKKTTTRVLKYPKIEVKPKIGNLSVKLDNRFAEIIKEIELLTKLKLPSRPIITLSKNLELREDNWLGSIHREDEFIELPYGIEEYEQVEVVLVQSAFFEFSKLILDIKEMAFDQAATLSLLFIEKEELLDFAIIQWDVSNLIPKNFKKLNRRNEINNVIEILSDFNSYILKGDFVIYESILHPKFAENFKWVLLNELSSKIDAKSRFAKFLHKEIKKKITEREFEIAARLLFIVLFLEIFSRTPGRISPVTLEITKAISKDSQITSFIKKFVENLHKMQIESLIKYWRTNKDIFPDNVNVKVDELTDTVFKKILKLHVGFTTNVFDSPGEIIIKIKNNSDAVLGTVVAEDIHWTPIEAMEIIGEKRKIRIKTLAPDEEYAIAIPIIPKKEGTINIRNLMIRFNDPFGIKHYVSLPIPPLKIKKK